MPTVAVVAAPSVVGSDRPRHARAKAAGFPGAWPAWGPWNASSGREQRSIEIGSYNLNSVASFASRSGSMSTGERHMMTLIAGISVIIYNTSRL